MIIHYNYTIGSFLLHMFLLIYHPYRPIPTNISWLRANLERQGKVNVYCVMRASAPSLYSVYRHYDEAD